MLWFAGEQWTGMTEAEVSLWRAPGAFTGIAATLVFPAVNKCLGVRGGGGVEWGEQALLHCDDGNGLMPQHIRACEQHSCG